MHKHQLTDAECDQLLKETTSGVLATLNRDGSPYAVPVQFVWMDGKVFIHGRSRGQKVSNILSDYRCSFTAYRDLGLLMTGQSACNTTEKFESVIIQGRADIVVDPELKQRVIRAISDKYGRAGVPFPAQSVPSIGVIEVIPDAVTGKYGGRGA